MQSFLPLIDKKISFFLKKNKNFIFKLKEDLNSPFNLIFIEKILKNIKDLKNEIKIKNINGEIFYSAKANNSAYLSYYLKDKINFECSSLFELKQILPIKNKTIINGPKNNQLIDFISNYKDKIILVINSIEEFKEFYLNKKIRNNFLIRVGNINQKKFAKVNTTRFGVDEDYIFELINLIKEKELKKIFLGFAFHVDSTSDDLKRLYLEKAFEFIIYSIKLGLKPKIIDIGGGIRFNYMEKKDWSEITTLIQNKVLNNDEDYLYNNYNFGIVKKDNRVFGEGKYYPYYHNLTGIDQLIYILNAQFQEEKIINLSKDLNINFFIETGRYLLKDSGGTIFKIEQIEKRQNNYHVILNGKNTEISANLDILYDPLLLKKNKNKQKNFSCFIFGNSCLEDDIFYKRKIYFETEIKKGDLLYFHNTIAYKTKFFHNQFINGNKEINIYLDSNYQLIKKEIL